MSQPLVVLVPHSLGKKEATRRLKAGLAGASDFPSFKFDHLSWSGDRVTFELSGMGQKASGTATVADHQVTFELVLPWLLQKFGELVQRAVRSNATILLEKK